MIDLVLADQYRATDLPDTNAVVSRPQGFTRCTPTDDDSAAFDAPEDFDEARLPEHRIVHVAQLEVQNQRMDLASLRARLIH